MAAKLTEEELKACETIPDVLIALADHHDLQAALAEPMGFSDSTAYHEQRAGELRAEASRLIYEEEKDAE